MLLLYAIQGYVLYHLRVRSGKASSREALDLGFGMPTAKPQAYSEHKRFQDNPSLPLSEARGSMDLAFQWAARFTLLGRPWC